MRVFYLHDEEARRRLCSEGRDHTPSYIPCLLAWMGVTGKPVSSEEASALTSDDLLIAGAGPLPDELLCRLAGCGKNGGPGAAVLFGAGSEPAERSPGIKAWLSLNGDDIPLFAPLLSDPDGITDGGEVLLYGKDAEGRTLPALVRNGPVWSFRFDLPGTVWFAGDGFSDGEPKNGFFIGRTPDTRPLPDGMQMPYPYNDRLLFYLEDILCAAGVPMTDRLPPMENGDAPDFALHISGDDDFTSAVFDLEAARRIAELGMPYHLNVMPGGERFVITREQAAELVSLGCELDMHTDFTAQPYTFEGQRASCGLFESWFGFPTLTGTNHCLIQAGMAAERLRWLGACGVIADNGKLGEVDPSDINAFNLCGFSFGTSFPRFTLDDAEHGNAPLATVEIPMNYYEPRIGNGYHVPERIAGYVDGAAEEGRIAQFFCHPHYLEPNSSHTPATLAALRFAFGRVEEKGYTVLRTSTDRIAWFWHARAASAVEAVPTSADEAGAVSVRSEIPLLIRLPLSGGETLSPMVRLDGAPVPFMRKHRGERTVCLVSVPAGEHRVGWTA